MKKIIYLILIAFTTAVGYAQHSDTQMFLETKSKYNFVETKDKISTELVQKKWKLLTSHDLQESLKKNNIEVLPIVVMELCKPSFSGKLLTGDEYKIYSSLMPCRISIYEKSDGNVYVSRMNSVILSKQIGGLVEEVMTEAATEIEDILKTVLE